MNVFAGAVQLCAEPVIVARDVHVLLSADHCSSALVCAAPVSVMCDQRKRIGDVDSMTVPFGSSASTVAPGSCVYRLITADEMLAPTSVYTVTLHWIVPFGNAFAGKVYDCVAPLIWIV